MNLIGKWKLKGINVPTEEGVITYTRENLPPEVEDTFNEADMFILEFLEDGTYNMLVEATEELTQMAKDEGLEIREDGYIVNSSTTWKEVDGKLYYDSGVEGEILDEAVDPFVEAQFAEDGCLLYNFGMMFYERI